MQCKSKFFKYEITVVLAQHDGYSNSFHKNTMSGDLKFFFCTARAMQHNDRSIQENHHVKSMFIMMAEDKSLYFLDVSSSQSSPIPLSHVLRYFDICSTFQNLSKMNFGG